MKKLWWQGIMLGVVAMLWIVPALKAEDRDPPVRVARMNFAEGAVSFQPGGEDEWLTAGRNRPLTSGDNIWTDRGSRAELHVGSTVLRLGPETSMSLLDLDDRSTQLRLAQGSLMLRVRHMDDDDNFEVDTPNLAFALARPGEYRVDVSPRGDTTVITVWQGQGEVTGGGYSYRVLAGQQARFSGYDDLRRDISDTPDYDDFESWAFDRDRREDRFESENYVSPEMTGYDDLDDYGRWSYVADYGNVWVPTGVPQGWAPYRFGHWDWIQPWGWTWVDDEPWGFAPFHYGRWAYAGNTWCWVPGPVAVRPVYAPALVAFVGGNPFGYGGGPAVGWFPLGPREVYVPGYRVSRGYVQRVNVTNTTVDVTQVTNVYNTYVNDRNGGPARVTYLNQRAPNAVTAVSRDTFVNARPVWKNVVQVNEKEIQQAPVTHIVAVQPAKASVIGAGAPAKAKPPAEVERRQVIANRLPTPVQGALGPRAPENRVKVESPKPPAPAGEARRERPGEASQNRDTPAARPEPPAEARGLPRPANRNEPSAPAPPRPPETRPDEDRNSPRPAEPDRKEAAPARASKPDRAEPQHPQEDQQPWSHPSATPVPAQRGPNPAEAQQEERKQGDWRQQRESTPAKRDIPAPATPPRPAPAPQPPSPQRNPAPAAPAPQPNPQHTAPPPQPQPPRNGPPQR
ncbi:MAG TPA: DUF6600 domain-containing protein [Terriglobales bacterium]|nr:DUF6600 domain-containing protein [Terriglobales bacterium]